MEQVDTHFQIGVLQKEMENIYEGYMSLTRNENPLYAKYAQKIHDTTQERLESLDSWRESEIEFARKLQSAQVYAINNDIMKQLDESKDRVFELLRIRHELLSEKLPNPAKYFKKFNNRFIQTCNDEYERRAPSVQVSISDTPLVDQDEIEKSLLENEEYIQSIGFQDGKVFVKGESFSEGSRCIIRLNDGAGIAGSITGLNTNFLSFLPDGGSETKISILSLAIGIAELCKQ